MLVKSQVKYIQNLGHKKFRDADGVFVAEGPKIVNELLQSNILQPVQCFATESWLTAQEGFAKGKGKVILLRLMKKNWKEFHSTIRRTRCWRYLQNPSSIRIQRQKADSFA